eukprot:5046051-Pyramimonas_sp.AAC.1
MLFIIRCAWAARPRCARSEELRCSALLSSWTWLACALPRMSRLRARGGMPSAGSWGARRFAMSLWRADEVGAE